MRRQITNRRHWIQACAAIDFLQLNDPRLTTVGGFLAALGADPELIRRYAGQVGIRMAKALRATGQRPGKVLVLVEHWARRSFRTTQNAYSPELLPLLAQVVADYPRTTHLARKPLVIEPRQRFWSNGEAAIWTRRIGSKVYSFHATPDVIRVSTTYEGRESNERHRIERPADPDPRPLAA